MRVRTAFISLCFALMVMASIIISPANAYMRNIEFGLNGHPFAQPVYRDIPVKKQLDLVKEVGGKWYRVDCYEDAIQPQRVAEIRTLIDEARKRGISILPVIFPPVNMKENDSEKLYKESYEYSKTLVGKFKNDIHVWELDNELDNFAILKKEELGYVAAFLKHGLPDGDKVEDYESKRIKKVMAVLKGLSDGAHSADPDARRIINANWVHTGLFKHIVVNKISFEIIGWHWYSDMGDITNVKGKFNLLERLKEYNRPVWITEINRRGGSQGSDGEVEQGKYLRDTLLRCNIEKVMIYELFDEPQMGAGNPEAFYGLVKVQKNKGGKWEIAAKKKAFNVVRDVLH